MLRWILPTAAVAFGVLLSPGAGGEAGSAKVAVASNFTESAREIASAFERKTGRRVLLSFGSTGQLYAQIAQGAPFEVFLAADEERPARAERAGLAVSGSRRTYAVGRLVLFSMEKGRVRGPESLEDPAVRRIALANPRTAPYGRAARETLRALGLDAALAGKRVIGTNVSQAHQFVRTGNADLGFLALAQVFGHREGSRWLVPEELHSPIRQQAVLLEPGRDNPAAARFLEFLRADPARAILRRRGYRTDGPTSEQAPRGARSAANRSESARIPFLLRTQAVLRIVSAPG